MAFDAELKELDRTRSKILALEARELIVEHGWCQGNFERDGAYCIIGSLLAAAKGRSDYDFESVYGPMKNWAKRRFGTPSISHLNDNLFQTKEEVLDFFDAVISEL